MSHGHFAGSTLRAREIPLPRYGSDGSQLLSDPMKNLAVSRMRQPGGI